MERLYKGILKFQEEIIKRDEEFYRSISDGQAPDTLFITCCDSRVDPYLMTQSKPGDLFVVKNVGNIIPTESTPWKKTCIATAIEFALNVLKVSDIVVCGHSDCGAIKALSMDPGEFYGMPNLKDWLETVRPLDRDNASAAPPLSFKERLKETTKRHIVAQIENLKTYAIVDKSLKEGKISIHGWYFEIPTGDLYIYNARKKTFERLTRGSVEAGGRGYEASEAATTEEL